MHLTMNSHPTNKFDKSQAYPQGSNRKVDEIIKIYKKITPRGKIRAYSETGTPTDSQSMICTSPITIALRINISDLFKHARAIVKVWQT